MLFFTLDFSLSLSMTRSLFKLLLFRWKYDRSKMYAGKQKWKRKADVAKQRESEAVVEYWGLFPKFILYGIVSAREWEDNVFNTNNIYNMSAWNVHLLIALLSWIVFSVIFCGPIGIFHALKLQPQWFPIYHFILSSQSLALPCFFSPPHRMFIKNKKWKMMKCIQVDNKIRAIEYCKDVVFTSLLCHFCVSDQWSIASVCITRVTYLHEYDWRIGVCTLVGISYNASQSTVFERIQAGIC